MITKTQMILVFVRDPGERWCTPTPSPDAPGSGLQGGLDAGEGGAHALAVHAGPVLGLDAGEDPAEDRDDPGAAALAHVLPVLGEPGGSVADVLEAVAPHRAGHAEARHPEREDAAGLGRGDPAVGEPQPPADPVPADERHAG